MRYRLNAMTMSHYGSFELGLAPFSGLLRADIGATCDLIDELGDVLPAWERFRSVEGVGDTRVWGSLEELRDRAENPFAIGAIAEIDDVLLNVVVSGNNVFVRIEQGDQSHDTMFLEATDLVAARVDLSGMIIAINQSSGGQAAAGFTPYSDVHGLKYSAHSPVMYFPEDVFLRLGPDALRQVESIQDLEGPDGQIVKRVQVSPLREYDLASRDLAFELIAPIRSLRTPVRPSREPIRWESYSTIEAVLLPTTEELAPWHPDWGVHRSERSLDEWKSSFDDNLRLNPAVYERAKSFEFPLTE